jgi:hypothetical protein
MSRTLHPMRLPFTLDWSTSEDQSTKLQHNLSRSEALTNGHSYELPAVIQHGVRKQFRLVKGRTL